MDRKNRNSAFFVNFLHPEFACLSFIISYLRFIKGEQVAYGRRGGMESGL
jgi:hypothetical protein